MNKTAAMVLRGDYKQSAQPAGSMLLVRTADQCMKDASIKPIPRMLFSEFWHEGELCILFADTNTGKSILAVQMADRIARGQSDSIYRVEADPQQVLYLDFELSDKQFEQRYSDDYRDHYQFHPHLYRVEVDTDYEPLGTFEEELEASIESVIASTGTRVLIVDNVTYLKTQSTEAAKDALPLMKMLSRLKKKYNLSILVLAHTPKRDHHQPITVNDLAGSKHFSNFADSVFTIGQSHRDPSLRYLKQIKARATEKMYDSNYVMVCRIEKERNFLGFVHVGFDKEYAHLRQPDGIETDQEEAQVIELYNADPTLSLREIARQVGMNHKRVKRILSRNGMSDE